MIKAVNLIEHVERILCTAHTLQLAIGKGLKSAEILIKCAKRLINFLITPKQNKQLQKAQELLKISKKKIDDNELEFLCAISDTPTRWNSSYIAWKRLLQIKRAIKLMEATMSENSDYNIRKDAIRLKSLMITEEEWKVLEELTMLLAPFAEITELLGGSTYSTVSFMWPAITTLTRTCEPMWMSINDVEIDFMNMSTIFEEEEEDIIDFDEELEIITTSNGNKFKLSQPQNTESLVEKVKASLHKALNHYWDAPLDSSLIAMLLDPHCKSMKKLDSWERDKAISLLQEEYNLLSNGNETINNLPNEDQNENHMKLFSIMFGSDEISIPNNEVNEYLKINQVQTTMNPLNWWEDMQERFPILSKLARKYLAMPATSTPSERLFSSAGNLMTAKRTSINTNLFERILFLKKNISILGTLFESQLK